LDCDIAVNTGGRPSTCYQLNGYNITRDINGRPYTPLVRYRCYTTR